MSRGRELYTVDLCEYEGVYYFNWKDEGMYHSLCITIVSSGEIYTIEDNEDHLLAII